MTQISDEALHGIHIFMSTAREELDNCSVRLADGTIIYPSMLGKWRKLREAYPTEARAVEVGSLDHAASWLWSEFGERLVSQDVGLRRLAFCVTRLGFISALDWEVVPPELRAAIDAINGGNHDKN